ncbi:MAG: hypothetical protein AABY15_02070 [Nanoarchaeota archaeon]
MMDFEVTTRYAGKKEHATHVYGGFHPSKLGVEMHGYKSDNIVRVELEVVEHAKNFDEKEKSEPGIYTGVYFFSEKETKFVYSHILATKVCSPDFFKHHINDGEAVFVKVKVKEIEDGKDRA